MAKEDVIEVEGTVVETLPNAMFRVAVNEQAPEEFRGRILRCTLSGKMRLFHIRVMPGDSVRAEVTRYDLNRGRITFRSK